MEQSRRVFLRNKIFQWHNPLTVTFFRVSPFHACGHENVAELLHADARERAQLTLAQQGDEFGKGNGQGLFVRTGGTEVAGKSLFRRANAVEGHVGTLDFRLFFRREPMTLAAEEHGFQLGVDLGMFDVCAVDRSLHLHAEETVAARKVGEQFMAVGCGDEGGDARQAVEIIAEGMIIGQAVRAQRKIVWLIRTAVRHLRAAESWLLQPSGY
jgi:hypothetical protein